MGFPDLGFKKHRILEELIPFLFLHVGMVLNEEKRAKLAGILARCRRMSGGAGTSSPYALAFATAARTPSYVTVPFATAQASLAPFPCEKVVEIEFDEDSAEGQVSKKLRLTTVTASHSSTVGRPTSSKGQTPSVPSSSDLFALADGGTSIPVAPSASELPVVLQHALKGFYLETTVDLDETAARERLGVNFGALLAQSNALITKLEVRSFATREVALK